MGTLWTFGCSFTAEYYPVGHELVRGNYDEYKDWRGGTLPNVWPTLLGKKLNLEVKNMAFGGDSNYAIFDQFLNVVDLIKEGDVIIFGWTHAVRFQAANPISRNGFNQILPSITDYPDTGLSIKAVEEILVNRSNPIWIKEVLNWIKLIDSYSGLKNIKSYHWASDGTILKGLKKDNLITVPIPFEDLCGYVNSDINYKDGISKSTIHQETNGEVEDGHHGEFGHKLMCDFIYNKFNKKII